MKLLAGLMDRFLNWLAPLPPFDPNGDWLADEEADRDTWLPDELWAAHQRLTDPATPRAVVSVTPAAGAVQPSRCACCGHLNFP